MEDWAVWPIFILQALIFALIFVPRKISLFNIRIKVIVLWLLLIAALAIVFSVYHDSTTSLHLYF